MSKNQIESCWLCQAAFSVLFVAVALFALAAWSPTARAQVLYGSLTGTVADQTGAIVPHANVTVTNQATGETRNVVTNGQGQYLVLDLAPGPYSVTVAPTSSFAGFSQRNVAVGINQQSRVDVKLSPASVKTVVTVNTAPPVLQTQTAQVTHTISESQLAELPITSSEGRNFQALYTLIPGAANVTEQNSVSSNPSRAMSVNVNGMEDMSNTTRIDGAINTYGWLPYLVAYVPPADALESVNFTTNSFDAEQGMAGGAAINVTIKSGTNRLHGSAWEYNELYNVNARSYTATPQLVPRVPKNIFNEFGFSIGGPVYIPKILKGKNKLFFFVDYDRTTRRQLLTAFQTVPTTAMLGGDFSAVLTGAGSANTTLYDPQPGGPGTPYVPAGSRPTFLSEYGCNCIPTSRQSSAAMKMLALLQPISAAATNINYANQLVNDYFASDTLTYNNNKSDSKITYNPTDRTSIFGRYSFEPYSGIDPQPLGQAGGAPLDGGQAGASSGLIQNVGLGLTHVVTPNLLVDWDFGYTRQRTGAASILDQQLGDFGLDVLGIPGTNGIGPNYVGQPAFVYSGFSDIGDASMANPYLFRDNQFTTDVNVSWTKGRHITKYGFTWYHFDLNHFQPTSGGGVTNVRGGFEFEGGMTSNSATGITHYNALADFLLGMPELVQRAASIIDPNAMRWTQLSGYASDQWRLSQKLTLNYGVRYEFYPAPYRDHTGVYRADYSLPLKANVEIGGVNGNPENAGIHVGWGMIVPRVGIAYRVNARTVVRSGFGLTNDPDSLRFLRDTFPIDLAPSYGDTGNNTIAVDPSQTSLQYPNGLPLTLSVGIPAQKTPDLSSGFASLPISSSTVTVPKNYRRGYVESWNLFVQQDLGAQLIMNLGYVGNHDVRQITGWSPNSSPLPSGSTTCMANGQYNPSTGLTGTCSFTANEIINQVNCNAQSGFVCYNTGGMGYDMPLLSANYNALQAQLTRNAGRLAQFGIVYTWSKAMDYADNGAGTGGGGPSFQYPAYFPLSYARAGYDHTHNVQFWSIWHLPFGSGQRFANHGIASAIFGGFQLNGQMSHVSGSPFTVSPSGSSINAAGNSEYADLVAPYQQIGGHSQSSGSNISGGKPWFNPASFANPVEPVYTPGEPPSQIVSPRFGTIRRNEFRGPGYTGINASVVRSFHIWRESAFQVRVEAFNLLNHPQFGNPSASLSNAALLGYILGFSNSRTLQFSGRITF